MGGGQGHPPTAVAFAIIITPILKQLANEFPDVLTYALHDDITMMGKREQTERAWRRAVQLLQDKLDLKTNHSKSLDYIINPRGTDLENASRSSVIIGGDTFYGVNICSIPMGSLEFVKENISNKFKEIKEIIIDVTKRLVKIDARVAYMVVKYSLQNKLDYLLANISPDIMKEAVDEIDNTIRKCFWETIGADSDNDESLEGDVEFNNDRLKIQCKHAGGGTEIVE